MSSVLKKADKLNLSLSLTYISKKMLFNALDMVLMLSYYKKS